MFFQYRGGRINYSDSGTGSVIVLLHGYLESSDMEWICRKACFTITV